MGPSQPASQPRPLKIVQLCLELSSDRTISGPSHCDSVSMYVYLYPGPTTLSYDDSIARDVPETCFVFNRSASCSSPIPWGKLHASVSIMSNSEGPLFPSILSLVSGQQSAPAQCRYLSSPPLFKPINMLKTSWCSGCCHVCSRSPIDLPFE